MARTPIPGVGATKIVNFGGATDWYRVIGQGQAMISPVARYLTSVTVIRPMVNDIFTLHDVADVKDIAGDNLVYKIDSGWASGVTRKGGKGVPPAASAGTTNTTGTHVELNIPLMQGLAWGSNGANGEFLVCFGAIYAEEQDQSS
jgi:hypothetical protein